MKPRAITSEELKDQLLDHFREVCIYWSKVEKETCLEKIQGAVFSCLAALDGDTLQLPAFDLVAKVHESDKAFNIENGENWVEQDTVISTALHEFFYKPN